MSVLNGNPVAEADVREQIREFIEANFMYLEPGMELKDGDQLLELGLVDSLGFVEIVTEVQERFGVVVEDIEITEENFGSVDGIVAFVAAKRGA